LFWKGTCDVIKLLPRKVNPVLRRRLGCVGKRNHPDKTGPWRPWTIRTLRFAITGNREEEGEDTSGTMGWTLLGHVLNTKILLPLNK
jgi:hypothetical protein